MHKQAVEMFANLSGCASAADSSDSKNARNGRNCTALNIAVNK